MTEDKRSPLHDWHVEHGADIVWEDGYPWAMHEGGDPRDEYEAVRTATGIWDLYSTCKYEVRGPDAARLIQRRFTNALDGMQAGSVRYGAFVNADGLMIDDGNVYKFADDHFLVMINTAGIDDWFRETADGLDATIDHKTDDYAMIAVQGPTSQATLQPLTGRDLGELRYFRFWPEATTVAGAEAWVLRTGFSGEKGYEVVVAPGDARRVWDALIAAGATPFGLTAIDLARTEIGLIIIAVDYNPGEISPWDLSMDRFIKTDTECVGAAALAERGANPPKRFKTLKIDGDLAPDYGAAVTKDGREVGVVTSPASSPRLGTIGLAILDADVAERRREGRGRGGRWHGAGDGRGAVAARSEQGAPAGVGPRGPIDRGAGLGPPHTYAEPMTVTSSTASCRTSARVAAPTSSMRSCEALHVPGARVVYAEADPDHNRLDTTVLGDADAVRASALAGATAAVELIDMRAHRGGHPRMGAADVIPFMPVRGVTIEDCVTVARGFGRELAERLDLPVYLYDRAALVPDRASLAEVRRGRVRGPAGGRRPRRAVARSRSARDRACRGDGRRCPQAPRRLQRLPRRLGRARGEGDREDPSRVQRGAAGRACDRVHRAGTRRRGDGLDEPGRPRGDGPARSVRRCREARRRARHGRDRFRDRGAGAGLGARRRRRRVPRTFRIRPRPPGAGAPRGRT